MIENITQHSDYKRNFKKISKLNEENCCGFACFDYCLECIAYNLLYSLNRLLDKMKK